MCFCLSGCTINWWTNRSSLAFSFTALYPVFSWQDTGCFVESSLYFHLWLVCKVKQSLTLSHLLGSALFSCWDFFFSFFFHSLVSCSAVWISSLPLPPALLLLFLPSSTVPCFLVRSFWAMLSSPTMILQPYGLPVYQQTPTCYPGIVQVKTIFQLLCKLKNLTQMLVFTSQCCQKSSLSDTREPWSLFLWCLNIQG